MGRREQRKHKRESMPLAGLGRIDALILTPEGKALKECRSFAWDISLQGGSIMLAGNVNVKVGSFVSILFSDTFTEKDWTVRVKIIWCNGGMMGFRLLKPDPQFLAWAKSRFLQRESESL